MRPKNILNTKNNLYLIFDLDVVSLGSVSEAYALARECLLSGADILQVRFSEKWSAAFVYELARRLLTDDFPNKMIVVNNRADIASLLSAPLHVGQDDLPADMVKERLNIPVVGLSCHSDSEIERAQKNSVDYFSIGPIFPTRTKPDYKVVGMDLLKKWYNNVSKPFVAIGGVTIKRAILIKEHNPWAVAVCRDILEDKNPLAKIKAYAGALKGG